MLARLFALSLVLLTVQGQAQTQSLRDMTEDQRIAVEEQRLGRPLTQAEREVKIAMDKFKYQPRISMPILISRTEWTPADEVEFGKWVAQIGRAVFEKKCATTTSCIRNPAINKYAPQDPPTLALYSDCADLPYFLRAYFAYHNGLPFSFVNGVRVNTTPYASANDQQDRLASSTPPNSPYGNQILGRGSQNVAASPGREINFPDYVNTIINRTSTATNRVGALTPNSEQSDIFPITLDRNGIRPGTVVAATGHAMVVWDVSPQGEIRIIDGHPGSFVQEHLLVNSKIRMSRPDQGVGYYQFRPLTLVGARRASNGYYYGGQVVPVSNSTLISQGRYSLDQWFGVGSRVTPGMRVDPNQWKRAFASTPIFDYITAKLRAAGVKVNVEQDIQSKLTLLCSDIKDRLQNYEDAYSAGVNRVPHPATLLQDIYGAADAAWEKFSTPGGDSRMRESVGDLVDDAVSEYQKALRGQDYETSSSSPSDFANRLRGLVAAANRSCAIAYTNSRGQKVPLTLNEVSSRLDRMSFDPYMCPEKIWGAVGSEMSTCADSDIGWYAAEKYMRNVSGKTDDDGNPSIRSDRVITIQMLNDTSLIDRPGTSQINLGTARKPVLNLDAVFASPAFVQRL